MDPPGVHGAMLAWADDAIERGHFREGAFRFAPAPAGAGDAHAAAASRAVSGAARRELGVLLENKIQLLVHEAGKFARAARRDGALRASDVNDALALACEEPVPLARGAASAEQLAAAAAAAAAPKAARRGGGGGAPGAEGAVADGGAGPEPLVDLRALASAPLPPCPVAPGVVAQWVCVDGRPTAPAPTAAERAAATVAELMAPGEAAADGGGAPGGFGAPGGGGGAPPAVLSRELHLYLGKVKRERARAGDNVFPALLRTFPP